MPTVFRSLAVSRSSRLKLALTSLAILLCGGTAGLMLVEKMSLLDALYMVVITLSTVGYGEIHPLSPAGRILIMCIIGAGVVTVGMLATIVIELVLEGQVQELVTRRKMDMTIAKLEKHSIIAGFGRVGRQVATEFTRRKMPFVVLERDERAIGKLRELGYLFVQGDATREESLRSVRIEHAKTLVSTLPEEWQNVYLTLTARYLSADITIIARADLEEGEKKLLMAGANYVVVPHVLGGIRMAMASLQPNVLDFMSVTGGTEGLVVEEIAIPRGSHLVGKTLLESNIKPQYGATVVAIKKPGNDLTVNPGPQIVVGEGDILVVIGENPQMEKLSKDLRS